MERQIRIVAKYRGVNIFITETGCFKYNGSNEYETKKLLKEVIEEIWLDMKEYSTKRQFAFLLNNVDDNGKEIGEYVTTHGIVPIYKFKSTHKYGVTEDFTMNTLEEFKSYLDDEYRKSKLDPVDYLNKVKGLLKIEGYN